MWALDPVSGICFSGYAGDQQMLFTPDPDVIPLRKALRNRFAGETVSVETIERFVIEETDYKITHYKRVLKVLENKGLITCESQRKRRGTYPPKTILRFVPLRNAE